MEEWRAIPGFEGLYEVSDLGRVRSLDRTLHLVSSLGTRYTRGMRGKVLRVQANKRRCVYNYIGLTTDIGSSTCRVAGLVALAFIGPRPEGMDVCHRDGDSQRDHSSNLKYATRLENNKDKVEHGTQIRGEEVSRAKLTEAQVRQILIDRPPGTLSELGAMFGVSKSTISRVLRREIWRHV